MKTGIVQRMLILFCLMINTAVQAQDGKATTEKKTFKRTTSISQVIEADASVIWGILTDASDFARWNSTVVSLEGTIAKGEKIRLVSTLDPKRTFKLKVKEMVQNESLTWGDGLGERVYTLKAEGSGTRFTMSEKIGGAMFPLFAGMIPPFDESFEQFTADLKKEAESR